MRFLFAQQREQLLIAGVFDSPSTYLCRSTAWHAHDDAAKSCREKCSADESFCVGCSAADGPGGPFRAVLERHHPCGIERRLRAHGPRLLCQHRCHGRPHDPRHVRGHLIFWKEKDQSGLMTFDDLWHTQGLVMDHISSMQEEDHVHCGDPGHVRGSVASHVISVKRGPAQIYDPRVCQRAVRSHSEYVKKTPMCHFIIHNLSRGLDAGMECLCIISGSMCFTDATATLF